MITPLGKCRSGSEIPRRSLSFLLNLVGNMRDPCVQSMDRSRQSNGIGGDSSGFSATDSLFTSVWLDSLQKTKAAHETGRPDIHCQLPIRMRCPSQTYRRSLRTVRRHADHRVRTHHPDTSICHLSGQSSCSSPLFWESRRRGCSDTGSFRFSDHECRKSKNLRRRY